jgi:hypothetical protein
LGPEPSGGFTLRISNIEGLKDTTLILPVAKESAHQIHAGMGKILHKVPTFGVDDMKGLVSE